MHLQFYQQQMRFTVLSLLITVSGVTASAQQDPLYSQFMYNATAVNPAAAGSAETLTVTALHREQWSGIEGAPETQMFSIDAPVMDNKIGLGLAVVNDKIGVMNNLNVNAQYAYRLLFNKGTLGMGLQAGMNVYEADYRNVNTNIQNRSDDAFSENVQKAIFNFGAGLHYYSEKFYAGFSVPHILNQHLDGISLNSGAQARQYRHYFLSAGYVIDAGDKFKIKPSTLVKVAEGAPVQIDLNSNFWYKETICLGMSYRTNDSFTGLFQLQIANRLRIGYAYDYITSSLSQYTTSNNEVMLQYSFRKKELSKVITPRYF